jgi:hypothetical protein
MGLVHIVLLATSFSGAPKTGSAAPQVFDSVSLKRYVYPLANPISCPKVTVDTSGFPAAKPWAEAAKSVVENWFTPICQLLATDGYDPITRVKSGSAFRVPKGITLVFKPTLEVPAYCVGSTITINGAWITAHPDDLGMVVHELTHVIQQYPDSPTTPGWLVEGIADYTRWWRYEPELHAGAGRTKINPAKSKYTDAYRTTAVWLAWAGRKYNYALVPCLDKAMRDKRDPMPIFAKLTGKNADDLWQEFVMEVK